MAQLDDMARAAGFTKPGEARTANMAIDADKPLGFDVVTTPIMPEGWFGMRTDKGVICVGPNGSFWVPFYNSTMEQSDG